MRNDRYPEQATQLEKAIGRYRLLARDTGADLAGALCSEVSSDLLGRACDSKPGGVSSRQILNQAEGYSPLHLPLLGPLSLWAPVAGRKMLARAAGLFGQELHPAPDRLALSPSLIEALQGVTDSASCESESIALAYAALRDGSVTLAELDELEDTWQRQDKARQQMRDQLRAMAALAERGGR